ncbi:alpha/beta-hydrolase [Sarocladium strictum]
MPTPLLPTIVAVPGAWHTIESFDTVKKIFTDRNYEFVSQNAPSLGDPNASVTGDAASLRMNLLVPLIDAGKDVVVMMHSYGGTYGSQAVQGLSKRKRQQADKEGGIVALVYVSAVTPVVGKSTLDMMGTDTQHLPSWVDYDESTEFIQFTGAREVMYHDIPEDTASHYTSLLRDQAMNSMNTPVSYSPLTDPNFQDSVGYVLCGADRVIPLAGQEQYAAIGGIKRTILVEKASHAFFATAPHETVDAVLQLSGV